MCGDHAGGAEGIVGEECEGGVDVAGGGEGGRRARAQIGDVGGGNLRRQLCEQVIAEEGMQAEDHIAVRAGVLLEFLKRQVGLLNVVQQAECGGAIDAQDERKSGCVESREESRSQQRSGKRSGQATQELAVQIFGKKGIGDCRVVGVLLCCGEGEQLQAGRPAFGAAFDFGDAFGGGVRERPGADERLKLFAVEGEIACGEFEQIAGEAQAHQRERRRRARQKNEMQMRRSVVDQAAQQGMNRLVVEQV